VTAENLPAGDPAPRAGPPTLRQVSKTERALTSSDTGDALDELFDDEAFDTAFDEAIEEADRDLEIDDRDDEAPDDGDDIDVEGAEAALAEELDSGDEDAIAAEGADEADAELDDDDTGGDDADAASDAADTDAELDGDQPTVEFPVPRVDDADELDDEDEGLPTIVQAIPDDDDLAARGPIDDPDADDELDDSEVSDRILEELRRADIDGPVVAFAPQDETTAARRRPKQAADYDPAPVPIPAKVPRVLGRKARVRKVTRVVRHVDPWSVFKISIVAFFVLYIIVLTASVLLWNVAYATGTIDNVERFFESFGWNTFEFNGGELYHAGWIAGLFMVIGFTGLAVLTATLFNLITDLVGGVRFTVLEEEVVETRTSPMRRFVVRRAEPEVPAVIRDASGAMYREAVVDDTGANARPTR